MDTMTGLKIFICVVFGIKILFTPIGTLKFLFKISSITFVCMYLLFKSLNGAFWVTAIAAAYALSGIGVGPGADNRKYRQVEYVKPKQTWSEKRAEKKAKEEAYWQYVSDVEDEATAYED